MKRVKIIAEIGVNHNGSIKIAKKIIKKLSKLDIDYIKFQLAKPENVYSLDAFKADYQKKNDKEKYVIDMSKKLQLSRKQHAILKNYCKKYKKKYLCTAFDLDSLKYLVNKLKVPLIKIPSGEIVSYDILQFVSKQSKEIILSTGMASFEDIRKTLKILTKNKKKKITILHCTSLYPVNKILINLNVLDEIKKRFKRPIGYSDHSLTDEACLGAIAKGASIIEKHVTLNNNMSGPDHKASYNIVNFTKFVEKIRDFEIILGRANKVISKEENAIKLMARKSIVSKRLIRKGIIIKRDDICFKRPGTGFSPLEIKKVLGKKTKNAIMPNRVIKNKYL